MLCACLTPCDHASSSHGILISLVVLDVSAFLLPPTSRRRVCQRR
ncbi:hypothetical protein PAHAL_2G083100 [Panicum hallii]|uniref:Uncharacterized protein n=1 Tax=Panicum hallii TaxID=206008 RepID=A0A2T8KNB5_9POAL|nr:hypothetical protein PAHAL_2G083100 [Panicum hallii]